MNKSISMIPVNSSDIKSIGYDPEEETLRVEFLSGATYEYYEVTEVDWEDFRTASSYGRHFRQHIKGKFRYSKVIG